MTIFVPVLGPVQSSAPAGTDKAVGQTSLNLTGTLADGTGSHGCIISDGGERKQVVLYARDRGNPSTLKGLRPPAVPIQKGSP